MNNYNILSTPLSLAAKDAECRRPESHCVNDHQKQKWTVSIHLDRAYEIRCVEPLLEPSNTTLIDIGESRARRFIVLDDGIPDCFIEQIKLYFSSNHVMAEYFTLRGGESCKNFATLQNLIDALNVFGLNRKIEPIIIFGGGAVLDLAAFAASIYRRGVPFIRVPTTLLSFVDAGIGIKNGINFGDTKNLIGSFTTPLAVFLDRTFLSSLSKQEMASGFGEILKIAVACDENILDALEANAAKFQAKHFSDEEIGRILFHSIDHMLTELCPNIYENNMNRALDLGHTFSQVFELNLGELILRHGEAVALDINLSAMISMHRGILSQNETHRIARITELLGLPMTVPNVAPQRIWDSVVERTHHRGGQQRIPIPERLGKCLFINDLTYEELVHALEKFAHKTWRD